MPRIYVANLAAYNAGRLKGVWIDIDEYTELDEVTGEVTAMLAETGDEEFAIHDYEGFGEYRVGEYESLERVVEIGRLIESLGYAFSVWMADDSTRAPDENAFTDDYAGEMSIEDYAYEFVAGSVDLDSLPKIIRDHIDYGSIGRDFLLNGDMWESNGHLFYSR